MREFKVERFPVVLALAATLVLPVGCATKGFVREELGRSEIKVEQRLALHQDALSMLESRVGDVSTRTDRAAETAGLALTKAEQTDNRLSQLWAGRNRRELVDTVVLTFGFNRWELDDRGETTLMGVVKELNENPNLFVDLEGYTDITGPTPYNLELSARRVEAVRRFLVEKGIDLPRIHSIGLGAVNPVADNKTKEGRIKNRRVNLRIFNPSEGGSLASRSSLSTATVSTAEAAPQSGAGHPSRR